MRLRFCPGCDLKETCIHEGSEGKLSPLCLDGIATIILRAKSLHWGRGSDTNRRGHSRRTR
jgi:hypothetical protein